MRNERPQDSDELQIVESPTFIFLPRLTFSVRVLHPQLPRLLYPMRAGYSAKPASQHPVHHSSTESIPVWFTAGFIMFMAKPESLVPQLRHPGCHVGHTEYGMRGLVAAGSSSVDVLLSWLISNAGKKTVQRTPKRASDGSHAHVTMLPRDIIRRRYTKRMPRLVELFCRGSELMSVASFVVQDGKLPQSVVSAFHCRCPSQVSFGETSDRQGHPSVQRPTDIGALQREGGFASHFCDRWWRRCVPWC